TTTTSRRWLWCTVIGITMTIPPIYNANHRSSISEVLEQRAATPGIGQTLASTSLTALDEGLTARVLGLNPMIQRSWIFASVMLILWGLATAVQIALLMRRSRS